MNFHITLGAHLPSCVFPRDALEHADLSGVCKADSYVQVDGAQKV